jgi:hypothetical protein
MTGVTPNTGWLGRRLALDGKQFVKTGAELPAEWTLHRATWMLETSRLGTFAVAILALAV